MDVISILRKKRQPVTGLEIRVRAEQAADHPKAFTAFVVEFRVRGAGVDPEAVSRAIELSSSTYCSVGATLKGQATVETRFEIVPPE
jgi:putative redox protein